MTISTDPEYQKPANHQFEVVMLKLGVSEFTAKKSDILRIPVDAPDSVTAKWAPEVVKREKEYRVVDACPPGYQTEMEMQVNQREYAGNVTDRANIGLLGKDDHVAPLMPEHGGYGSTK